MDCYANCELRRDALREVETIYWLMPHQVYRLDANMSALDWKRPPLFKPDPKADRDLAAILREG